MRTNDQLLADLKTSKKLGLPFELTAEERARAFGDAEWPNRDMTARITEMCRRYKLGLALSKGDVKEVKKYLKGN
jgi:hypothetical protein